MRMLRIGSQARFVKAVQRNVYTLASGEGPTDLEGYQHVLETFRGRNLTDV